MLDEGIDSKARAAAVRWARWRLGPLGFADLITRVDTSVLHYGRLVTRYAVRTGTWAEEAYAGGANTGWRSWTAAPLRLETLDLWSASPEALAEQSSHLTSCDPCQGAGQVTCPICDGSLRADCSGCGGSGQRMSRARKNYRMVNCSDCRGKGTKKCLRCSKGLVVCDPCRGSGTLRRWVQVTTAQRTLVRAWPDPKALSAHPGLLEDSPRALQWQGSQALASMEHPGPLPDTKLGEEAQSAGFPSARASLEPELEPLRGRILSQTLDVFESPSATVCFEFAGRTGFVHLLGRDLKPTQACDTWSFHKRFWALLGMAVAGFFGVPFLGAAFTGRHAFYDEPSQSGLAVLAILGLWPGTWWWTATWLRRRRTGGAKSPARWHDRIGIGLTSVCALVLAGCFLFIRPSVSELTRLTAEGQLREAGLHADLLEARGESSPAYVEARNAFVLARLPGMDNRSAIALIDHYAGSRNGTAPLEAERWKLREAWAHAALTRGEEGPAEAELAALSTDRAPASVMDGLRAKLEDTRIAKGKSALEKGDLAEAIQVLSRIQARTLVSERPEPLITQAYLRQEHACPARDVRCRASALHDAVAIDTGETARTALASFRSAELTRMEQAVTHAGGLGASLRELRSADEDASVLLSVLEGDAEVTAARATLLERKEALLRNRFALNEPVEVAQALLGPSGLELQRSDVFRVVDAPSGTLTYLFVGQGTTRGLYVTTPEHGQKGLSPTALQEAAKRFTGQEFSAKDLVHSGKGVAHVPARLGRHAALLGWHDDTLVEAQIGRVEP
ncbi:zinc finger-like domain-containing protein [Corallococcus carmarthensis]|uniref:CR-type domain-containing protein n=1 Tax=Corallococcus carmarthensis TaxID=2316728 RepID=A0A3A8KGH1_9BACT|nr:zinc finger-like domain-containing protein [Corallococcus carmarthensis]NOK22371.1 hypothetical protein [Corallococcus carmarthensis]RKH07080.1 hypothetical protein D7X32_03125 [Corallococcus carmarthensis]